MMSSHSPAELLVLEALQYACSQNVELLKPAEQKLSEWETESGYYTTLVKIFSDQTIDAKIRWMASLLFKNGVERYWRKNAPNALKQEEKINIKAVLIRSFNEPVPQIAVQIAVLIAKIARFDCPREWPELIPVLLEAVRTDDQLQQHRALLVLVHVVKTLSAKRLHHDRVLFEDMTNKLYEFILNLWDGFTMLFFNNIKDNLETETCEKNLEKAILSLRILKKFTIYGFLKPNEKEHCMMFLKVIFERLKILLECRLLIQTRENSEKMFELIEKFILKHIKFLNVFLEYHRTAFTDFVQTALEFSFHYVFYEGANMIFKDNVITFPNFAIQCLNLSKGILSKSYNSIISSSESSKEEEYKALCNEFYTAERINYIFEKLVMHYFLLTQQDFDLWDRDPESYDLDEGGDPWKYNLRACTECFYMVLFQKFNTILIKELQGYIHKAQTITLSNNSDMKDILIKDSIYNATGLAIFSLFDEIDFDEWFLKQLLVELKIKNNNFRIIRKRIIWLVGEWTSVKFSKSLRTQVYTSCLDLLQPTEDMAVRLTAAKTLKNIMNDFEFNPEQFLEFLDPTLALLFTLLKQAEECDTKMNILNIMSFIVEKMSLSIKLEADNLVQYLPLLWEESNEHNMLRCAIISSLLQIIKALYELPENITPFIYNVIEFSTNMNEPSHIYLIDEGLELYLIVVQYSKGPNSTLLKLFDNILPIVERSSSHLQACLYIIQTYIYLCPGIFLEKNGKRIVDTCFYLLNDLRPEGHIMINKLFLTILRVQPTVHHIELLRTILVDIMKKLYEDNEFLTITQLHLQIIARVLLIDQGAFNQLLEEVGVSNPIDNILKNWLKYMRVVTAYEDKKILALALISLITVPSPIIYEHFGTILSNVVETLNDIMKFDLKSGKEVDSLILQDDSSIETNGMYELEDYEYKTPHFDRCREIFSKDPAHNIKLNEYTQSQMNALKNQLGYSHYKTLLTSLTGYALYELNMYIDIGVEHKVKNGDFCEILFEN